jgi:hypothetical protein
MAQDPKDIHKFTEAAQTAGTLDARKDAAVEAMNSFAGEAQQEVVA